MFVYVRRLYSRPISFIQKHLHVSLSAGVFMATLRLLQGKCLIFMRNPAVLPFRADLLILFSVQRTDSRYD